MVGTLAHIPVQFSNSGDRRASAASRRDAPEICKLPFAPVYAKGFDGPYGPVRRSFSEGGKRHSSARKLRA
jgi:hypothetical protein